MSGAAYGRKTHLFLSLALAGWCSTAFGYRPFEGTDAAVAEPGEIEIELGPLQSLREGPAQTLIAPEVVINYGLAKNWEAVWEGELAHDRSELHRIRLIGNGAFLKGVLREGGLQDRPGPSIASEFGLLLPGINDDHGTGASVAGIVSYRWPLATVHLNAVGSVTREHNRDIFIGTIVEGPQEWQVRPVAEVFREHETDTAHTTSVLIGAIWRARDRLAFDVGLREANRMDHYAHELRAGLTYSWTAR
jgi:hypothetical protein